MTATQVSEIQTVALYARQSSGEAEERDSLSIGAQLDALRTYASNRGWVVALEATDPNTSGRLYPDTAEARTQAATDLALSDYLGGKPLAFRRGLGTILGQIGRIDCVLVYDETRLYRPLDMSYLQPFLQQALVSAGVSVCTNNGEPQSFLNFSFRLLSSLRNTINDDALKTQARKSIQARNKLLDSGQIATGKFAKSYGFRSAGKRKVEIVPEQANAVRWIFEQYAAGVSANEITRTLNVNGTKPQKGPYFRLNSLLNILRNTAYIGVCKNTEGKEQRTEEVPHILDDGLFYRVQARIAAEKKGKTRTTGKIHPLSGLLICPVCGEKLLIKYHTKGAYNYYLCKNASAKCYPDLSQKCKTTTIRETTFATNHKGNVHKSGLLQSIAPIVLYAAMREYLENLKGNDIAGEVAKAEAELSRLDGQLTALAEKVTSGEMEITTLILVTKPIENRKRELQSQLRDIKSKATEKPTDLVHFDWDEWFSLCGSEIAKDNPLLANYRDLARRYLDRITVYVDRITVALANGESLELPRYKINNSRSLPIVGDINAFITPAFIADHEGKVSELPEHLGKLLVTYHSKTRQLRSTDTEVRTLLESGSLSLRLAE